MLLGPVVEMTTITEVVEAVAAAEEDGQHGDSLGYRADPEGIDEPEPLIVERDPRTCLLTHRPCRWRCVALC